MGGAFKSPWARVLPILGLVMSAGCLIPPEGKLLISRAPELDLTSVVPTSGVVRMTGQAGEACTGREIAASVRDLDGDMLQYVFVSNNPLANRLILTSGQLNSTVDFQPVTVRINSADFKMRPEDTGPFIATLLVTDAPMFADAGDAPFGAIEGGSSSSFGVIEYKWLIDIQQGCDP